MTYSPLSWVRAGQKGCASSLFQSFVYEVCGGCYVGYMLLPDLLMFCLCSIVSHKFLTGLPCIRWLLLIYPHSVGEPKGLTGPPCVLWLHIVCPLYSKILKGLPRSPWWLFLFDGMFLICNLMYYFPWSLGLPSLVGVRLMYPLFFLIVYYFLLTITIGGPLIGLVLGAMGFTLWVNTRYILSLHGIKGLHCWYELLIPT